MELGLPGSMGRKQVFVLFVSLLVCLAHGQDDVKPTAAPTTAAPPPTTVTTVTTAEPTAAATNKSTTSKSTTPVHTVTTASTTTQKPDVKPATQKYYVHDDATNITCIVMDAAFQMWFTYINGTDKQKNYTTNTVSVEVPTVSKTAQKATGNCGNNTQSISIKFFKPVWTLTMTFNKTKNDIVLSSSSLDFSMHKDLFPGAVNMTDHKAELKNVSELETPIGQGFRCNSNHSIKFNVSLTPLDSIQTHSFIVEAFRTKADTGTDEDYTQCEEDSKISNIVPIAVGAALGALVLIVLIAYLVGRKRNQRGYESV